MFVAGVTDASCSAKHQHNLLYLLVQGMMILSHVHRPQTSASDSEDAWKEFIASMHLLPIICTGISNLSLYESMPIDPNEAVSQLVCLGHAMSCFQDRSSRSKCQGWLICLANK